MPKKYRIPDDPVVQEVRRWRTRVVRDAGGTLDGLVKMLRAKDSAPAARRARPGPKPRRSA